MRRWLWMTAGLLVWAVQFSILYALTSLADVVSTADDLLFRVAGGVVSLGCLALCVLLLARALRRRRQAPSFEADLASLSAGAGCLAVVWQALPLAIGA